MIVTSITEKRVRTSTCLMAQWKLRSMKHYKKNPFPKHPSRHAMLCGVCKPSTSRATSLTIYTDKHEKIVTSKQAVHIRPHLPPPASPSSPLVRKSTPRRTPRRRLVDGTRAHAHAPLQLLRPRRRGHRRGQLLRAQVRQVVMRQFRGLRLVQAQGRMAVLLLL